MVFVFFVCVFCFFYKYNRKELFGISSGTFPKALLCNKLRLIPPALLRGVVSF